MAVRRNSGFRKWLVVDYEVGIPRKDQAVAEILDTRSHLSDACGKAWVVDGL